MKVRLGVDAYDSSKIVSIPLINGGNILCESIPRYGKGAVCKPLTVKVSRFKRVCVFDYKGEWIKHITKRNWKVKHMAKINDYYVAQDFVFKITSFDSYGDWIGFGLEDDSANAMMKILAAPHHNGDLDKIEEMIRRYPTAENSISGYYADFGINAVVSLHPNTKRAWGNRFEVLRRFFWQGGHDKRKLLDFAEVWKKARHVLIDLSDRRYGFRDIGRARAYAGLIVRQIRPEFSHIKPLFVFEEASQLLEKPATNQEGLRVGVSELHKLVVSMVSLDSKTGVLVLLLVQHRDQIYEAILPDVRFRITGKLYDDVKLSELEKTLNASLVIDTTHPDRREWWLTDKFTSKSVKFAADVPCCEFETNV